MKEKSNGPLTVARQRALSMRLQKALAVRHLPQEEPVPPLYPGWTSFLSHEHVNDLAACDDELWAATRGGVVRWRWEGEALFYTRYASEHGLPGSRFERIALDRHGRPWVGGRAVGLSYLDGTRWCTLTAQQGLPCADVLCLTAAPDGELWVGTASGIGRVSLPGDAPRWRPFDLSGADLPAGEVKALAVEPGGALWLGTCWGLYRHEPDGSSWRRYTVADGLADSVISHLLLDPDGQLWVGTVEGLCAFDGERFAPVPPVGGAVWRMAVEPESGALWVVAAGKVWRGHEGEWSPVAASPAWGEKAQGRAVAVNARGQAWVGFDRGLVQQAPEYRVLAVPPDTQLLDDGVNALALDERGRVWAGTACREPGRMVYREHGRTASGLWILAENAWRRLRPGNELGTPLAGVESIAVSPTGEVWVGSWLEDEMGGLRCFTDGVETSVARENTPACVDAMTFGTDGRLWVAAQGLIWVFDGKAWSQVAACPDPGALVQALQVDAAGRLWCGSTGGLDCYEDGAWRSWVAGDEVNALVEDAAGRLWVGTLRGLCCVEEGQVRGFEGDLPAEEVLALAVSQGGELWVGTSGGLARLREGELDMWRVGDSGLVDGCVRALVVDDDGMVWVGTGNGVSCFDVQRGEVSK
jgi:ligand-binding sensor domain-containing protein